ncbi:MAG: hypothetical protein HYR64_07900 [Fimbriimonas ginsengisoli]|uniref:Nuclear transport factor 2 family protein n=1 Tax=Fimbriimonas ginsengisoli TaxID=1005039 RepID=A0A931LT72_FIMGI|nr:hypothetical protein [Fimbriimonas ginsengisoli]
MRSPQSPEQAMILRPALLLVAANLAIGAVGNTRIQVGASTPAPPARHEDVSSIDAIVRAAYDVISGPQGQKRDWDRFRTLFTSDARFTAAMPGKDGNIKLISLDVPGFIKVAEPAFMGGFFEKETWRHVDAFAGIAQAWSAYESRFKADDERPFQRGINSFQLWNDGGRWWIVSIYWQAEDKSNPVPPVSP